MPIDDNIGRVRVNNRTPGTEPTTEAGRRYHSTWHPDRFPDPCSHMVAILAIEAEARAEAKADFTVIGADNLAYLQGRADALRDAAEPPAQAIRLPGEPWPPSSASPSESAEKHSNAAEPPALDVERLAGAMHDTDAEPWDITAYQHWAKRIAAEYARLAREEGT